MSGTGPRRRRASKPRSVLQEVFDEIEDCWQSEGREKTKEPFKGRLANSLAEYPETLNLKLKILIQPVGRRPLFYLEEEHRFKAEQTSGVTPHRAQELASLILHQYRGGFPDHFPQPSTGNL
ncbi:MAG: DUF2199 domain-containing protein [Acidobacteriota bacterium]